MSYFMSPSPLLLSLPLSLPLCFFLSVFVWKVWWKSTWTNNSNIWKCEGPVEGNWISDYKKWNFANLLHSHLWRQKLPGLMSRLSSPDSPDVQLQGKFKHTYISFCLFVCWLAGCLSPSKTKPVISYSIHWYNYNKFVPCIFVVLWTTHYLKAYLLLQLLLHCWQFIVSLRIIRKQPNYCRWLLHMAVLHLPFLLLHSIFPFCKNLCTETITFTHESFIVSMII